MPEHTPAPTPARAVYGFAVFIFFKTLFVLYVIWAYVPRKYLEETLGIRVPDKYFAQTIPIVIIFAIWLFAFAIYPMMGLALTSDMDSIDTIRDEYTLRLCEYQDAGGRRCRGKVASNSSDGFYFHRFCAKHLSSSDTDQCEGTTSEDAKKDFCDCPTDENCLVRTKSDYLTQMRLRKRVAAAYDLDIADVCKRLYRN